MKKVSVIVPCYNTEDYLNSFLEDLEKQTYKNFDVIFINDCSKDNTEKILDKIVKEKDNYFLINNDENHGAGYSRNRAIEMVKSDYIMFLDADDKFPEDYIEKMFNEISHKDYDMVICDMQVRYDDSFGYRPEEYNKIFWDNKVSKEMLIDNTLAASPVNKIYKTELIKNNLFAEGIINEDIPAILGCIVDAKKVGYVKDTYYTYIQHGFSVQNSKLSPKKLDVFKALDILYSRKDGNELLLKYKDAIAFHQLILFLFFTVCAEPNFLIRKKYLKLFYEKAKEYPLRDNHYYWRFVDQQSKYVKLYFKVIMRLLCLKLYGLASFVVSMRFMYKKIHKQKQIGVVKQDIKINDLVKVAKQNQNKENCYGTLSVIIPNYNYSKYLYRRLFSILSQNIKIEEIIILDDCSKDNSRDVIDDLVEKLNSYIYIKKIYNEKNSGCVYKQWQKGFENSKGEYVWIAEADDYSDSKFLETVMEPFGTDDDIIMSYTDTSFMLVDGRPTLGSMNILIDLMKTKHWEKDYINVGINEIENYCFLNCTIANASSVIFKNGNYKKEFEESTKYKQVGDWLFYVNIMKKGKIAYTHKSLNYCCIHDGSSTATMKKINHFNEIKSLHERFKKEYNIKKSKYKYFEKRYNQLRREWNLKK